MASEDKVRELVTKLLDEAMPGAGGDAPGRTSASTSASQAAGAGRRVAVGADHGGYRLKESIVSHLRDRGWDVVDCGTSGTEAVDYPDFAQAVAEEVASGSCWAGIVVDGAGIGSSMAANKIAGVRAALCYDLSSARNSREHNHANVLTLGAGLVGGHLAVQIVDEWLATSWGPGRHARRVAKIDALDRERR